MDVMEYYYIVYKNSMCSSTLIVVARMLTSQLKLSIEPSSFESALSELRSMSPHNLFPSISYVESYFPWLWFWFLQVL